MTTNDCPGRTYTTPKGLQFAVYCGQDQTDNADIINDVGVDSVEDCMDQCALHPNTLCEAAAFDGIESRCYFMTNITDDGAYRRDGWTLAVANIDQTAQLSSDCTNGQKEKTDNGLEFIVFCDQNLIGQDVCHDADPECRKHTTSMKECQEYCSTLHPLCTSVVWDPSVSQGYLNCYPKNATASDFDAGRGDDGTMTVAAKALLDFEIEDDCIGRTNKTLVASNKAGFKLSCDTDHTGDSLTEQHASSLQACVDACATYDKNNTECVAAVFEASMGNGYQNCYLKKAGDGNIPPRDGFTLAVNSNASNKSSGGGSGSGSSSSSHHKKSEAWVAGPAVGGVIVLLLLVVGLWWWRKRRQHQPGSTAPAAMYQSAPTQEPILEQPTVPKEMQSGAVSRYELHSGTSRPATPQYELDSSPSHAR